MPKAKDLSAPLEGQLDLLNEPELQDEQDCGNGCCA
jgi:hypothetical protein